MEPKDQSSDYGSGGDMEEVRILKCAKNIIHNGQFPDYIIVCQAGKGVLAGKLTVLEAMFSIDVEEMRSG